jgi:hypothetical protein
MALILSETERALAPGVVAPDDVRGGVTPSTDRREGYVPSSEADGVVSGATDEDRLTKLRKFLRDYVDLKSEEIEERREANRYYHDKQWTKEELEALKERGQPPITYNRFKRKVNGVVGLLERLRQDPKAYPRTPAHVDGADVATQCLRYALDASEWESSLSDVVLDLSIAGVGGYQLGLEPADDESVDPALERVAPETFFYDPRSVKPDFSDARFLGIAKWMAKDEVVAFLPDAKDDVAESIETLSNDPSYAEELDPDKEALWWDREMKKVRVVEVWYREGDTWRYAIHTGAAVLAEGESPFKDGKGKSASGFSMQSCNVDEKGNRYGFFRTMKGPQDEINHRRSKALHAFNSRQITVTDGFVSDVETIRREAARVDGVIALPDGQKGKLEINSNSEMALANVQMLQEAKDEIENFGPNTATAMGQGDSNKSGRAIALLQQAAIAELGPFIVRVRSMKLRCYTLTWEAIRQFWTSERYVRITDDQGLAGFIGVNVQRTDDWGQPVGMENPIGKVMVDFVLDEGPDTVTLREDAQMALGQALSSVGTAPLPPQVLMEVMRALFETMNLPPASTKRIAEAFKQLEQPQPPPQPDPLQVRGAVAEVAKTEAEAQDKAAAAALKGEQAVTAGMQNRMNQLAAQIGQLGGAQIVEQPYQ